MLFVRELAARAGFLERRKQRRLPAEELDASYPVGSKQKRARVKDVSPSGAYFYTRDRWSPGTSIDVTLLRRLSMYNSPDSVRLRMKIIRLGSDGVGAVFEPEHVGADIWVNLVLKSAKLGAEFDLVRVLRATRALAFLRRVSPASESRVMQHIAGESVYESGERAVETLLKAEEMIESWKFAIRTGVSPNLILSILENASTTNSDWVRQHWTGLLASSVKYWARESESIKFVALLSRLHAVQIRILDTACSVTLRAERDAGCALRELTCSKEMLLEVAGVADLFAVEQHLDHLYHLDLLKATVKRNLYEATNKANLTPTRTGLWLYARCRGLLQPPEPPRRPQRRSVHQLQAEPDTSGLRCQDNDRIYAPA